VTLGATRVDVAAGTRITWRREGDRIRAAQTGSATWRVGVDDTLTIDAMLASIEATHANVRVEVEMNSEDKRAIAISAAVAMVTVVVYEGTVDVIESHRSTRVAPGATYRIAGPNA
ncbi:MAG TPA: hypothetical protein VK427_26085, partial [Kofleriaceae bacterium]|nr:hypothetical protein [Kofleriaceae bacterium]